MKLHLDHASPVPLYHQIAEALRYRIATGELAAGTALPPLREASRRWGAHLHTVRRAYAELARSGVVATRAARGTVVQAGASPGRLPRRARPPIETFVDRVAREARLKHGIGPRELADLLVARVTPRTDAGQATVYVAECSETQSSDLACQIMDRWHVTAVPWPTHRPMPPAGHPIVATYFHFNEVRTRWTERLDQVRFLAIRPDPALALRLAEHPGGGPRRRARSTVVLCEQDDAMLHNILADLTRILPRAGFRIRPCIVRSPDRWMAARRERGPVLFSPRLWGQLSEKTRRDPRVHEARFVFEPSDLDAIGATLGWAPR